MATLSWFNTFLVEHSELWVMATLAEFTKVLNLGYDYFATTLAKVRFTGIAEKLRISQYKVRPQMGYSQAVRRWILVPIFAGSSPANPAAEHVVGVSRSCYSLNPFALRGNEVTLVTLATDLTMFLYPRCNHSSVLLDLMTFEPLIPRSLC
jgi:hypothetical protein